MKTLLLILLTAASGALSAAPVGYSINSDSTTSEPDSLYTIDLATGQTIKRIGLVNLPPLANGRRQDVEGLAFAPDGTLYGIDDESLKLFRIDTATALVDPDRDYLITGDALTPKNNDFGMTFACDGTLYVSSIVQHSLYKITPSGTHTASTALVGDFGAGIKIGALAAYGTPTMLYGLSNGQLGENAVGTPHLYSIDTSNGSVTDLGTLGGSYEPYSEAGLSFDENGHLWAITDRSTDDQSSQVLRIDIATHAVVENHTMTEQGFESLAISTPRGCKMEPSGDFATFAVRKQFTDGNHVTPVTFNFSCSSGTVANPTRTIYPEDMGFGPYQVSFVVESLPSGDVSCEIEEIPLAGYTPSYECESDGSCSTGDGAGPCVFEGVSNRQQGLCLVSNAIDPVEVTVTKEWLLKGPETIAEDTAQIYLICANTAGGNGSLDHGIMRWHWIFDADSPAERTAIVYPSFSGDTECWTEEILESSAVESESSCEQAITILPGDSARSCVVSNTVFYEGIPTLNSLGLLLASALLLMTGLVSVRRFA